MFRLVKKIGVLNGVTKRNGGQNWYVVIFPDFSTFINEDNIDHNPKLEGLMEEWARAVSIAAKKSDNPLKLDRFRTKNSLAIVGGGFTVEWQQINQGREIAKLDIQEREVYK